ncbi:hypothetical protein D3C81_1810910 [compost metagenome]
MVEPTEGARCSHAAQYPPHERGCAAGDEEDCQRHAQPGYGANDPLQQIAAELQQIVVEAFAPRTGIGKARQDKAQPFVRQQQHDDPAHQLQQAARQRIQVIGVDQRNPSDFQGLGVPMHQFGQFLQHSAPQV